MKNSITITSSSMVRPIEHTPKGRLWLSRLDMVIRQPYSHTNILFVYPNNTQESKSSASKTKMFFDADILKTSLSQVLVPFYPMAGRLTVNNNNGRYELDCNDEGVLFIEAESTDTLNNDIGKNEDENKLLYPMCDYSKGLSTFPLTMVQLTRFKCGGVCLGFSVHHHVADGSSHVHFVNSWGRLARGLDINVLPVHDRFNYVGPRDPPRLKFPDMHYMEPSLPLIDLPGEIESTITERTFKISVSQIKALRENVMSYQEISSYDISTFIVLAGHVWRTACKARHLKEDQDTKLLIPVDGRLPLKLPLGYCGNVILFAVCKAKVGDLINKPLWYTVSKICEGLAKMKEPESFRSAIDYIETRSSFEPLIEGIISPNLSINSWIKLPFKALDFGWGGPKFTRHGGNKYEGLSALVPNESEGEGGSLLLVIKLFSVHMASFEKFFYDISLLSTL